MRQDITQLVKIQDRAAIEQLYNNYSSALYSVILRIVICEDLAQQVMQDTFLKAWRYGANYDESKGGLFTWLVSIARNTAIDFTRSVHFRNTGKIDNIDILLHFPANESVNSDVIGLKDLVQKMQNKHRILIELIYFGGYTQQEASEETGVPIGTVKTRLRHAILSLRETFDQPIKLKRQERQHTNEIN